MSQLFMVKLNTDDFGYTQMKMFPSHTALNSFFSVEFKKQKRIWFRKHMVKCGTHWHPQTIEQAIADVEDFMNGKIYFVKTLTGVLTKR